MGVIELLQKAQFVVDAHGKKEQYCLITHRGKSYSPFWKMWRTPRRFASYARLAKKTFLGNRRKQT